MKIFEVANPKDVVAMDVPFLIRALEYAREDAKDDMALHDAVERMIDAAQKGKPLDMSDYDLVFGADQGVAEGLTPASTSKVLRLIQRHHDDWFDTYGIGEVEDTVVDMAEMGQFQGMSAEDAVNLVGQELESMYGQQGVAEGKEEMVGFHLDSERAYEAVMARFGHVIDHDEDSGTMYVPERLWPTVEAVAYDADGIGAQRDDDLENPEHYGVAEGDITQLEKDIAAAPVKPIANMEADEKIAGRHDPADFDAMVNRLKKLAGAGPLKTVYDPNTRRYKNVPVAQQPK